jgi:class 3 adenylate cyclase
MKPPFRRRAAARPQGNTALRRLSPIALAVLLCGAVLWISWWSYAANRRDTLALTDETLASLEDRVGTEVSTFLAVPERVLGLAAEFAGNRPPTPAERKAAEETAVAVLNQAPMLALIGYGDANGNWIRVRRTAEGTLETKIVAREDGARRAYWLRTAADGSRVIEDDPEDNFDPRTRPWWQRAMETQGVGWTDVYVFFTDRKAGVTASRALRDGPLAGVVMADIRLEKLSQFLAGLTVGRTGRALILDQEGRLVALGDPTRAFKVEGETISPARLNELADPILTRAFDLFRVNGPGRRSFELDGRSYIVLATRLPGAERAWNLLMVVPEDDFVGFVARNSRTALLMGFGVMLLAGLLAWQVVRQNFSAERARALAASRATALAAQGGAYGELAAAATPEAVLTVLAGTLAARRTGLWRLAQGDTQLVCEAQFDAQAGTHASGLRLRRAEAPRLFEAITAGVDLDLADAAADPRGAELARLYLKPMGTKALLALPVRCAGGPVLGTLWVEDRGQGSAEPRDFTRAAAALLAPGLAAAKPAAQATRPRAQVVQRDREKLFIDRLAMAAAGRENVVAETFPRLAVLAVVFTDDAALAAAVNGEGCALIDRLARVFEAVAAQHGIPYLRLMGERVMLADGFPDAGAKPEGDPAIEAARRLADAALALQERLAETFTAAERGLDFRLGLDLGPAIGSRTGGADKTWNVWGEAVRLAHALAETAPPGAIQASEAVQAVLAQDFVLRARGKFFVPDAGELGTFLLAGTS